jgi:hypothetical protein
LLSNENHFSDDDERNAALSPGEHHMDMQENIHKTRIIAGPVCAPRALGLFDAPQGCLREMRCLTSWASSIRSRRIRLTEGNV